MNRYRLLLAILLLLPFHQAICQSEVDYYADTLIFNRRVGNNYISDSTGAKLICIVLPMNYEKALPGFQNESNKNIVIIDKSDFLFSDKRFSHKKGRLSDDGTVTIIDAYLIEIDSGYTVSLTAIYDVLDQKGIADAAEKAAKSVRLN